MKVILKEEDAAYDMLKQDIKAMVRAALIEVMEEIQPNAETTEEEQWCDTKRALQILGIGKTKMQQLRDHSPENGIVISQHGRTIRYSVPSLYEFLQNNLLK